MRFTTPLEAWDEKEFSRFPLFQNLSSTQYITLKNYLKSRSLEAGATVISQGNTGSGVFLLVEGTVKVFLETPQEINPWSDEKEVIVAICGPGEIIGEIDMVDSDGHTASVTTLEKSSFLCMATDVFWECQSKMPELGRNLSRILGKRLRRATTIHNSFASLHLPGKIAFQLLLLAQDYGIAQSDGGILLPLRLRQSEIAALVGSTRESVNRVFASFKKSGLVEIQKNSHIILRDTEALRDYCLQAAGEFEIPSTQ